GNTAVRCRHRQRHRSQSHLSRRGDRSCPVYPLRCGAVDAPLAMKNSQRLAQEAPGNAPARAVSAPKALQAIRGMNDVLPDKAPLWERFESAAAEVFRQYGYCNLRVPLVEPTPLFVRAIGAVTDVVEHEMYTFEDKLNGESLTLRPEATAGIVRAAIQHSLIYERPQRVWTGG